MRDKIFKNGLDKIRPSLEIIVLSPSVVANARIGVRSRGPSQHVLGSILDANRHRLTHACQRVLRTAVSPPVSTALGWPVLSWLLNCPSLACRASSVTAILAVVLIQAHASRGLRRRDRRHSFRSGLDIARNQRTARMPLAGHERWSFPPTPIFWLFGPEAFLRSRTSVLRRPA